MNMAVLQVEGDDESLDALVTVLELVVDRRWEQGNDSRRGAKHSRSGFSVLISDAPSSKQMSEEMRGFVATCEMRCVSFTMFNVSAVLSIGVTVGDSSQYTAGLRVSTEDMAALCAIGLPLSITAYPTSDEVNAEDH